VAPWDPRTGSGRLAAVLDPQPADPREPLREPPAVPADAMPPRSGAARRGSLALAGRWLPAAWRGARLDPGWPGAVALLLVAAVAAVLAAVGVWRAAPRPEPVAELPPLVSTTERSPEPASGRGPSVTPGPPEQLVVAVAGRVARPGLVRVAAGARVADVLDAAGGALPGTELAGLNLARRVSDGEQVAVGVPPAPDAGPEAAPPGPAGGASSGPGGVLDLNTASVEQLDGLPGVGPVMAQRIVEWRTRNGRFAAVDQLREVEGIGERRFAQLRGLVRI
jgi:competence protein ComEA